MDQRCLLHRKGLEEIESWNWINDLQKGLIRKKERSYSHSFEFGTKQDGEILAAVYYPQKRAWQRLDTNYIKCIHRKYGMIIDPIFVLLLLQLGRQSIKRWGCWNSRMEGQFFGQESLEKISAWQWADLLSEVSWSSFEFCMYRSSTSCAEHPAPWPTKPD